MSLIEVMVWIAVFTLAMIALTSSLLSFYRVNRYALQEANAIAVAQHGMDVVVQALRTAMYSNTGAYPVVSIAPQQVAFYANVYKNDPLIQEVRFYVSGNSLFEGIIEPVGNPMTYPASSETVIDLGDFVQNLADGTTTFQYFDQNGAPITDYSKFSGVRFVTVNLIVDVSTSTAPTELLLSSSAALRNLIDH